jgi:hypothetical protein
VSDVAVGCAGAIDKDCFIVVNDVRHAGYLARTPHPHPHPHPHHTPEPIRIVIPNLKPAHSPRPPIPAAART